jgi:hypothetical protein
MARVLRHATVVSVLALVMSIPVSGQEASPAPWDPITPGSSPAPMSRPVLAGSWSAIPDAPWGTIFPAAAYTGEELLVVDLPTGRTLGYDSATGVWTRHERSPKPFDGVSPSVWTGTEIVILDRYRANRDYAYDPEARAWRKLARSPLDEQWLAVLAGEDVVVRGRKRDMAMYDLAADRWSILPEPPGGRVNSLSWTGSEVLAVMSGGGPSAVRVAALDPGSRTWSDAVMVPLHARSPGTVWIDARPVFPDGAAPPGTAADAQAIDDFDCLASAGPALWTGDVLVGRYADAALDPETGECYALPDIEVWDAFTDDESRAWVTSLWTGGELFWWSGAFGDSRLLYTDGIAFGPTPSAGDASGHGEVSGTAIKSASSPFERLWRPFEAAGIPFRYRCATEDSFSTMDLADATPTDEASDPLAEAIGHWGGWLGGAMDWHVVNQVDDRVLALAPTSGSDFPVDELELTRTITDGPGYETWDFVGGGNCRPEAVLGRGIGGQWRLDPRFPAPGPTTRTLHVLGYVGCNGTEKTGPARFHATDEAMLIAIPMASTFNSDACSGPGPTRMTVRLPEPLGRRTLYDAGSLPLRRIGPKTGLGIR